MMAKGILSLSSEKKTVLLPENELFQQDAITCWYQNEQEFREKDEIQMVIDTFFDFLKRCIRVELFQQDAITCRYQNEQAFREESETRMLIDTFYDTEKNYRRAIQNKQDKDGKIQLEYRGNDGALYHLTPLYKEDLENLRLKELKKDTFIKKIKSRRRRKKKIGIDIN